MILSWSLKVLADAKLQQAPQYPGPL